MTEDVASVLEHFINDGITTTQPNPPPLLLLSLDWDHSRDTSTPLAHIYLTILHIVANLPNEIAHIYEEIQAKDKLLLDLQKGIQQRDGSIQKFIKINGSHAHNPKEETYSNHIRKAFAQINIIQDEKVAFAQKALDLVCFCISFFISQYTRTFVDQICIKLLHITICPLALRLQYLGMSLPDFSFYYLFL